MDIGRNSEVCSAIPCSAVISDNQWRHWFVTTIAEIDAGRNCGRLVALTRLRRSQPLLTVAGGISSGAGSCDPELFILAISEVA